MLDLTCQLNLVGLRTTVEQGILYKERNGADKCSKDGLRAC